MRKKLFAILMSAMMMVTFMPSMAFAAVPTNPEEWVEAQVAAAEAANAKALEEKVVAKYFELNPHEISLDRFYKAGDKDGITGLWYVLNAHGDVIDVRVMNSSKTNQINTRTPAYEKLKADELITIQGELWTTLSVREASKKYFKGLDGNWDDTKLKPEAMKNYTCEKIDDISTSYANSNMKAGKKIHLDCGQDIQIYECQTKHCGYKTYAYTETKAGKHPAATKTEMSVEEFVQAYVQEQADELLSRVNLADTVIDAGTIAAGGAIYTASEFYKAADGAAKTATNMFITLMGKMGPKVAHDAVEAAFKNFFVSISPWGIAHNITEAAGLTAAMLTDLSQKVAYGVIGTTATLIRIVGVAADEYYGLDGEILKNNNNFGTNEYDDDYPWTDKNGFNKRLSSYVYKGSFGLQNICKMIVTTCPDCGIIDAQIVEHKNSKGKCATNFVCDNCDKKVWVVENIVTPKHAQIKMINTNEDLPSGKGDVKLLAGKIDVEKLDCATTISYKCADCGEAMISLPILKKDGHDPQPVTLVKATTMTKGIDADKCTKCGLITNVHLTDKVQHTHDKTVEEVVEPTCSMPGYTVVKCSCGQLMGVKSVVAPKKHDYKTETLVEPTCESGGIFRIYCGNVGCTCSKVIVGKGGNLYDLDAVTDYKNFTNDAKLDNLSIKLTDRITKASDILDILTTWSGHTKTEWFDDEDYEGNGHIQFVKVQTQSVVKLEDAKANGWKDTYYFTGFGQFGLADRLIDPIPVKDVTKVAQNHDFYPTTVGTLTKLNCTNNGVVTVGTNKYAKVAEANCTTPALWAVACKNCGAYDVHKLYGTDGVFEVGTALGHDKVVKDVAATCEHTAGTITTCTRCTYEVVDGIKAIPGGKCEGTGEYETLIDSTFTKEGTKVMYCKNCKQVCDYDDIAVKKLAKAYQPTLVAGKKSFTAKFKNVGSAASGVQIAYKVTGTNNYKYVKTTFKKSKTVKGLKGGKKYTVKVRKWVEEDGKTIYGKWCAVKYVTTKK